MRKTLATLAVVGVVTALAACGTSEDTDAAAGPTTSSGPVTVTDSRGKEVKLPAPATKVVVLEWGEAEMVQTLGVTPVGVADTKGYATWDSAMPLGATVKDVGTRNEPSVDAIVALDPDLVIAISDTGPAVVSQLEKYVPVLVTKSTDASRNLDRLREEFTLIATVLGRTAEAKAALASMDKSLADGKAKVDAAGATGTPFLMTDGWKEGSAVSLRPFGKGSLVSDVAESVGLKNAWTGKVDAAWGLGQTDLEGITAVKNPRTHLFYSASENDVFATDLAANPVWKALPFAAKDRMHKLDKGTWTFGGPKSVEKVAQQFVAGVAG